MGVGGLQRGWLAAAASRARPLEGDEKVGSLRKGVWVWVKAQSH